MKSIRAVHKLEETSIEEEWAELVEEFLEQNKTKCFWAESFLTYAIPHLHFQIFPLRVYAARSQTFTP